MARINGENINITKTSILDYLKQAEYNFNTVVVEKNLEIIRREDFDKVMIDDNDIIEILNFVGGG